MKKGLFMNLPITVTQDDLLEILFNILTTSLYPSFPFLLQSFGPIPMANSKILTPHKRAPIKCPSSCGKIIMQKAVEVKEGDTPEILQRRIMEEAEWKILPEAVRLFCDGRITVKNNKVYIKGE